MALAFVTATGASARVAPPAGLRGAQPVTVPTAAQASTSSVNLVGAGSLIGAIGAVATKRRSKRVARKADEAEGDWTGAEGFSSLTSSVPLERDNVAIRTVLPHRYPFLLVDKLVEFEAGKRAVGVKNVTANEPQFTGHFPDRPIMPGVLMVEAMAQLGGLICLQDPVSDGQGEFFFAGIDGIKFRRPVVPGDTLVMEMELTKWRAKYGIAKCTGKAYVDGELAVEVKEFTFALVQESK